MVRKPFALFLTFGKMTAKTNLSSHFVLATQYLELKTYLGVVFLRNYFSNQPIYFFSMCTFTVNSKYFNILRRFYKIM